MFNARIFIHKRNPIKILLEFLFLREILNGCLWVKPKPLMGLGAMPPTTLPAHRGARPMPVHRPMGPLCVTSYKRNGY